MKSDMKASLCAAVFRLEIVVLQCVHAMFVVAQLPVTCSTVKWERAWYISHMSDVTGRKTIERL